MFGTIAGLPLHPLLVHATEVIVPAAALAVALAAVWPRFRRWAQFTPFLLSLAAVVLVPLSTQSGEALAERVAETGLIERHSDLAEGMLPWVLVLLVLAAGLLAWNWAERSGGAPRSPRWVAVVLAVAILGTSAGTVFQAIAVGHSGASAVWSGK